MKRRSFLGALAAAPVAVPTMAADVARSSSVGYAAIAGLHNAVPQPDPHWHELQIEQTRRALFDVDGAPDDVFGMTLKGYGDPAVESLKSVSPAIKRQMVHDIEVRRARERAKQQLQQRLDNLLGNPLSKWDEFRRFL